MRSSVGAQPAWHRVLTCAACLLLRVTGPIYEMPTTIGTAPTAVAMRPRISTVEYKRKVPFTSVPRSSMGRQVRGCARAVAIEQRSQQPTSLTQRLVCPFDWQPVSRSRSAPSFGFGKSTRNQRASSQYLMTDSVAAHRKFGATQRSHRERNIGAARAHIRKHGFKVHA